MFTFLKANIGTITVLLIVVAAVALVIIKIIKDKKSGKNSCGGDCANCHLNCDYKDREPR